jgi:hypothetical protein
MESNILKADLNQGSMRMLIEEEGFFRYQNNRDFLVEVHFFWTLKDLVAHRLGCRLLSIDLLEDIKVKRTTKPFSNDVIRLNVFRTIDYGDRNLADDESIVFGNMPLQVQKRLDCSLYLLRPIKVIQVAKKSRKKRLKEL